MKKLLKETSKLMNSSMQLGKKKHFQEDKINTTKFHEQLNILHNTAPLLH